MYNEMIHSVNRYLHSLKALYTVMQFESYLPML